MAHHSPEKKLIHCKNCGNSFHGHYCNNCGQDAHTGKIDKHFIYHEIQHGLFHIDKGILYTLKELFTNPGKTIRVFIEGKRVRHFKPLAFLLVMAGLYAFVKHYMNASFIINPDTTNKYANAAIEAVNDFIKTHFAIYVLLQLPVSSYIYYLIFKKYNTNYTEQLVINAYLSGQRIFISLLLLPIAYYLIKTGHPFMYGGFDSVTTILLYVWAYPQYYNKHPKFSVVWRAILGYIIIYILLVLLTSIVYTLLASFPKLIA